MKNVLAALILLAALGCAQGPSPEGPASDARPAGPYLVVLGNVQDAGSPHAGCAKDCCRALFANPDPGRMVTSLGLVDPVAGMTWLFEATPDLPRQMKLLHTHAAAGSAETPDGIFLTHAHIGHYAGLMFLGREGMGAKDVPVHAMPRMLAFLGTNGPWDQLVALGNIRPKPMREGERAALSPNVAITPFTVPHRDEYSETVGYLIEGPERKALFIPDIDKWEVWGKDLVAELAKVDAAFIDATFFDAAEVGGRDIREIPHPFVIETMELLESLPGTEKAKVRFIHFNHTNPLLDTASTATRETLRRGFGIARPGLVVPL